MDALFEAIIHSEVVEDSHEGAKMVALPRAPRSASPATSRGPAVLGTRKQMLVKQHQTRPLPLLCSPLSLTGREQCEEKGWDSDFPSPRAPGSRLAHTWLEQEHSDHLLKDECGTEASTQWL